MDLLIKAWANDTAFRNRKIKVVNICLLTFLFCMRPHTSFGHKRVARVSVASNDSIVVQQRPVALTVSIENRLTKVADGTGTWIG